MKTHAPLLLVVVALLGCSSPSNENGSSRRSENDTVATPTPVGSGTTATLTYRCSGGLRFHALIRNREALLLLPDRTTAATQVEAASGVRYEGDDLLFWTKGNDALLEVAGTRHDGCDVADDESPWARAALEGIVFRGLGQEPGWLVDIHSDDRIVVEADYGQRVVQFPDSTRTRHDNVTTFTAEHDGISLILRILEEPCSDVMSGFRFPATVEVELDDQMLTGCGRPLTPAFPRPEDNAGGADLRGGDAQAVPTPTGS